MKLLLDENIPHRLRNDLSEHEVFTVQYKSWNGKKNGELLQLMLSDGFERLLTFDKNLQFQQNFQKYPIPVLVLRAEDNTYLTLQRLIPKIKQMLATSLPMGPTEIKE